MPVLQKDVYKIVTHDKSWIYAHEPKQNNSPPCGPSKTSTSMQMVAYFFGEIRKINKRRRIIVHNGNASSRTSAQISAFLSGPELMCRTSKHSEYNYAYKCQTCNVKLQILTPEGQKLIPRNIGFRGKIKKTAACTFFNFLKIIL